MKCDGNCEEHYGDVRRVRVIHKDSGKDWGEFHYCGVARAEDRLRGLLVTDVEDMQTKPEQLSLDTHSNVSYDRP